jgi:hypothetical protein
MWRVGCRSLIAPPTTVARRRIRMRFDARLVTTFAAVSITLATACAATPYGEEIVETEMPVEALPAGLRTCGAAQTNQGCHRCCEAQNPEWAVGIEAARRYACVSPGSCKPACGSYCAGGAILSDCDACLRLILDDSNAAAEASAGCRAAKACREASECFMKP